MPSPMEIGPLRITLDNDRATFIFADPMAMSLEIPPSFEEQLRDVVENDHHKFKGKSAHLDLANAPAISSRQLGMILTIREIMKPHSPLELHNVSPSVRHLLKLTGTERFFKF